MKSYNFANDDQAKFLTLELETWIVLVTPQLTTIRPRRSAEHESSIGFQISKERRIYGVELIQLDNNFDQSKISATTVSSRSLNKEKVALPEVG